MSRTASKRPEPRRKLERNSHRPGRRPLTSEGERHQRRMSPRVFFGVGGTLVVALFVVALVVGLSNEEPVDESMPENVDVQINGAALPPHDSEASDDPAFGIIAPEFSSVGFDGAPMSLRHDGRPKAVLFLAHWCSHCRAEVPPLQAYIDETGLPPGTELISVATSNDPTRPNYPPSTWLAREGWTAPVLVDDAASSIARSYGLSAFPYYVILDTDGRVVARISGARPPEAIAAALEQLATPG